MTGDGKIAQLDPVCRSLGIEVQDIGAGRARLRLRVTDNMVNGHGFAHGGFLFLLADAAFSFACNSHGPVTLAHSAQITFVRPAGVGDALVAEAVERTRYGRNGVYDVTVRRHGPGAADEIIAEFRGQSIALAQQRTEE